MATPCSERRRAHPTFLMTAEPPTWGAEREKQTYRQRIKAWNHAVVGDGNALPYGIYVYILAKLILHWWLFDKFVRDTSIGLFDAQNFVRFLLYNILGDALGFNATSGPLGFRLRYFYATWYNMLTPGTLTCPLVRGLPSLRGAWQCAGFALYLALLLCALASPQIEFDHLAPIAALFAALSACDLVTFHASRGEHYGYMLVCCLFPRQYALYGCQMVQAGLWFFAGTAKVSVAASSMRHHSAPPLLESRPGAHDRLGAGWPVDEVRQRLHDAKLQDPRAHQRPRPPHLPRSLRQLTD